MILQGNLLPVSEDLNPKNLPFKKTWTSLEDEWPLRGHTQWLFTPIQLAHIHTVSSQLSATNCTFLIPPSRQVKTLDTKRHKALDGAISTLTLTLGSNVTALVT